ncbi:hypothetical protein PROFUN_10026 [Planoprotostelium fungivorum]|uniref:Uncharacterized protein n=1 Tax=Planoprotostelium fungivorum TaxID=1890364 RepID=A0A2P6NFV8_9EUKA|nr:hypothetical protein PROFUN_10026 [Planoprotostelium fungivorum]
MLEEKHLVGHFGSIVVRSCPDVNSIKLHAAATTLSHKNHITYPYVARFQVNSPSFFALHIQLLVKYHWYNPQAAKTRQ